jgi:hypothetical protein
MKIILSSFVKLIHNLMFQMNENWLHQLKMCKIGRFCNKTKYVGGYNKMTYV